VTVTSPGPQTASGAVNLQIHASDLAGQPLTYTATGLPPGLSINAGTGLISGTAIPLGTYTVTVTASAGSVSGSTTFTWTISLLSANGSGPPILRTRPPLAWRRAGGGS